MFKLKRRPTHPGIILKEEFIDPLNISQTQLAKDLKTTFRTVNEITNEKRNISPEMAIKLSKYFGTTHKLWLNLQNQYDIHRIIEKKGKELNRIRHCKKLRKAA